MKFEDGEEISIKGLKYKVHRTLEEFDRISGNEDQQGWHDEVQLHEEFSKSFWPTHILKVYKKDGKMKFFEIEHEVPDNSQLANKEKKGVVWSKPIELSEVKESDIKKL